MNKTLLLAAGALMATAGYNANAQLFGSFESFDSGTSAVMFRLPTFSGSTAGRLETTPNTTVVTDTFPAGNNSNRALHSSFAFKADVTDPWLRLTTFNATGGLPNPTIDFTQNLAFMIYSDRPIQLAIGVRETGTTAAVGENGGTSGGIEWVGVTGKNGAAPIPTRTIAGGAWTSVAFDINGEPALAFAGAGVNGVVDGTKGTLEHLAIVPADGAGTYNIYLDQFTVTPVPEPSTYAVAFGLLSLGGVMIRRRLQK